MPVQTTYAQRISPAYAGLVADSTDHTILSYTLESAAGVDPGAPVMQGAADGGCIVSAAGGKFLGIVEASHFAASATPTDKYARYETIPVLVKGPIWVPASELVAAGDPVYVTLVSGVWSKTATGNVLIPNARWDTSTSGAGLAILRIL